MQLWYCISYSRSLLLLPYSTYSVWAAAALPVLVWSGPFQSHALNRLATLPSFTAGTIFHRRPHILPTVPCLAWLVQDLGVRSKVLSLCLLRNHSKYTSQAVTHKISILARLFISESCSDQRALNTSARNNEIIRISGRCILGTEGQKDVSWARTPDIGV